MRVEALFKKSKQTVADILEKVGPGRRLLQGRLQPFAYFTGKQADGCRGIAEVGKNFKKFQNPYESGATFQESEQTAADIPAKVGLRR